MCSSRLQVCVVEWIAYRGVVTEMDSLEQVDDGDGEEPREGKENGLMCGGSQMFEQLIGCRYISAVGQNKHFSMPNTALRDECGCQTGGRCRTWLVAWFDDGGGENMTWQSHLSTRQYRYSSHSWSQGDICPAPVAAY